jgi:hypothetical protein
VLHRVSRASIDSRLSEDNDKRDSDPQVLLERLSAPSIRCRQSSSLTGLGSPDLKSATSRRTSTQVTRMLLAVTLSLIMCNIPNTIYFIFVKLYDTRNLVGDHRSCKDISDSDINLYKFGFYSGVIQDILSDLPHIFNFFLYCLAGNKFRSIFINNVHQFLRDFHLIKQSQKRLTQDKAMGISGPISKESRKSNHGRSSSNLKSLRPRRSVEILFDGKTTKTLLNDENENLLKKQKS